MKPVLALFLTACLSGWSPDAARGAAPTGFRLPKGRDAFFIENNFVYSRFLALTHDGVYRQINKDPSSTVEVDGGTWEQAADGTVRLHSVRHALRFRAVLSGPLLVVLDSGEKVDALAGLAAAIRRLLDATADAVFNARTLGECRTPGVPVAIEPRTETFSRADLQSLARQLDDAASTERTGIYTFTPLKPAGSPALLILSHAVFQAADLDRVRRDYHVKLGDAPPFFFAQADARTFAREVGTWETFRFLGGIP